MRDCVIEFSDVLSAALDYCEMGFSVLPLAPRSKRPAIEQWKPYQETPTTPDEVERWFVDGDRNIGIVTGAVSGIVVLDVDKPDAFDASSLPKTPTVKTKRGRHYYFRHPGF